MIHLCKSTLHRPRARRPLASKVEEEAVRDDDRAVRLLVDRERLTSALHQVRPAPGNQLLPQAQPRTACVRGGPSPAGLKRKRFATTFELFDC